MGLGVEQVYPETGLIERRRRTAPSCLTISSAVCLAAPLMGFTAPVSVMHFAFAWSGRLMLKAMFSVQKLKPPAFIWRTAAWPQWSMKRTTTASSAVAPD